MLWVLSQALSHLTSGTKSESFWRQYSDDQFVDLNVTEMSRTAALAGGFPDQRWIFTCLATPKSEMDIPSHVPPLSPLSEDGSYLLHVSTRYHALDSIPFQTYLLYILVRWNHSFSQPTSFFSLENEYLSTYVNCYVFTT